METIVRVFLTCGLLSLCSMLLAVATTLLRPQLSKMFNPKTLLKIHRVAGMIALLLAITHAILYYLFLR